MVAMTASWFHLMEWYLELLFQTEMSVDSFPRFNQKCRGIGGMDDQKERVRTQHTAITHRFSFEINDDNINDLAALADKYIIDSLRIDIRVNPV
jgi:hypothetical protein